MEKEPIDSVFSKENADVWGWVYGIPGIGGLIFIILGLCTGLQGATDWGMFLILVVIGSFLMISFAEWINNLGS